MMTQQRLYGAYTTFAVPVWEAIIAVMLCG